MLYPEIKPSVGKFESQKFIALYPDMIQVETRFEHASFISLFWMERCNKEFEFLGRTFISGLLRLFRGSF